MRLRKEMRLVTVAIRKENTSRNQNRDGSTRRALVHGITKISKIFEHNKHNGTNNNGTATSWG